MDCRAVLCDVEQNAPLRIFQLPDAVISISFFTGNSRFFSNEHKIKEDSSGTFHDKSGANTAEINEINVSYGSANVSLNVSDDYFILSCLNNKMYIWNTHNNYSYVYSFDVKETITKVYMFPDGKYLCLGSLTSNVSFYSVQNNIKYKYSFGVKNKKGRFSEGRKVTWIETLDKDKIIVCANDNKIRIVDVNDGSVLKKFKGHKNEEGMLNCCLYNNTLISPSEDRYIYIWKIDLETKKSKNADSFFTEQSIKETAYEYFMPDYNDKVKEYCTNVSFSPGNSLAEYNKKVELISEDIRIKCMIVIVSNKGFIYVVGKG